jgi:hypothetical protein
MPWDHARGLKENTRDHKDPRELKENARDHKDPRGLKENARDHKASSMERGVGTLASPRVDTSLLCGDRASPLRKLTRKIIRPIPTMIL